MAARFELQGHRGARGLRPENTLPSFETAFDLGVTAIETDLHLTSDGVPVLCHDPLLSSRLCSKLPFPEGTPISRLSLAQLQTCLVDRNPDPARFPEQNPEVTPVAAQFAEQHGLHPLGVPTLAELFAFADFYGESIFKSAKQRERARRVLFDLELKRLPFHPEAIGDDFQGDTAGRLEKVIVEMAKAAGMTARTRVRSFDHRAVRALRQIEPSLEGAVLIAEAALVDLAAVARKAGAEVYCPNYLFLDEPQVRQAHANSVRVIPWTANDLGTWERLLGWGVDGITTDYPDRLAAYLQTKGVVW